MSIAETSPVVSYCFDPEQRPWYWQSNSCDKHLFKGASRVGHGQARAITLHCRRCRASDDTLFVRYILPICSWVETVSVTSPSASFCVILAVEWLIENSYLMGLKLIILIRYLAVASWIEMHWNSSPPLSVSLSKYLSIISYIMTYLITRNCIRTYIHAYIRTSVITSIQKIYSYIYPYTCLA